MRVIRKEDAELCVGTKSLFYFAIPIPIPYNYMQFHKIDWTLSPNLSNHYKVSKNSLDSQ